METQRSVNQLRSVNELLNIFSCSQFSLKGISQEPTLQNFLDFVHFVYNVSDPVRRVRFLKCSIFCFVFSAQPKTLLLSSDALQKFVGKTSWKTIKFCSFETFHSPFSALKLWTFPECNASWKLKGNFLLKVWRFEFVLREIVQRRVKELKTEKYAFWHPLAKFIIIFTSLHVVPHFS